MSVNGQVSSVAYSGRRGVYHESLRGTRSSEAGELTVKGDRQYESGRSPVEAVAKNAVGEHLSRKKKPISKDNFSSKDFLGQDSNKRVKKTKLKKLKSFMHVFLGGLRSEPSSEPSSEPTSSPTNTYTGDSEGTVRIHHLPQNDSSPTPASPDSTTGLGGSPQRQSSVPPPASVLVARGAEVPGLCGLHNHGNTCFMNAIVQCLSNTDPLAEYMVTDLYKNAINRHKFSSRNFSSQGEITEKFASLLKCLWNGQYDPEVTGQFKEVVGKYSSQYQGSSQHDAQEFFLWLLDSVHEDLNQGGKRKYRPLKDSAGRPDEVVAAEYLNSHMKRNNSFIQNLFQGQFRSAVKCPSCNNPSLTFDPYVCISLPLPQRDKRPIYVTVVYRSASRPSKVFGVDMPTDSSVRDLRNHLAQLCGINRYHLVLADLQPTGFNRTFYDDQHLSTITSGDFVFGFECPPYRGDNPEAISQANPSGSKELMLVLVINKLGLTQFGKRFGVPLILRIWRDLTHMQFQSVVLKAMAKSLREGSQLTEVCRSGKLFRCKVIDALPGQSILPSDAEHPFYSPSVDKALHVSMLYGGPAHIKLIAEWEPSVKAQVFGVVPEIIPEPHPSVQELREVYQQPLTATLHDCLNIYTKEETLNREDSWFCPHCKHQQKDATKKITLWTLPDVLVIHLKRFRHTGYCRTKLNSLVSFPVQGLDMTQYLAPRASQRPSSATLQRRMATSRTKGFSQPSSKSVRFDESLSKTNNRNLLTKEKRFNFLRRRKRDEESSGKRSAGTFSPGVCDSPSSIRSAPSAVGHSVSRSQRVHSPVLSLDGGEARSQSPAASDTGDNMYSLYAVCNHLGTMTRGHYTAFCCNPTDGQWYLFDDSHVQAIAEEELVTAGAYLLFYVRQSLMNLAPTLNSTPSSSSSAGSTHWAMHIPRTKLDVAPPSGVNTTPSSANLNSHRSPVRSRLGSTGSSMATPTTRGFSPQSVGADNESDVFVSGREAMHTHASSLRHHQASPGPHPHQDDHQRSYSVSTSKPHPSAVAAALGGRHASLRLGKQRQYSPDNVGVTNDQFYRRGTSFHGSHQHHEPVRRTMTNIGKLLDLPANPAFPGSGHTLSIPSRSIPNMTTENWRNEQHKNQVPPNAVPSRSIPDIMKEVPTTPGPPRHTHNYTMYNTPQLGRQCHASSRSYSISSNQGTESCV